MNEAYIPNGLRCFVDINLNHTIMVCIEMAQLSKNWKYQKSENAPQLLVESWVFWLM